MLITPTVDGALRTPGPEAGGLGRASTHRQPRACRRHHIGSCVMFHINWSHKDRRLGKKTLKQGVKMAGVLRSPEPEVITYSKKLRGILEAASQSPGILMPLDHRAELRAACCGPGLPRLGEGLGRELRSHRTNSAFGRSAWSLNSLSDFQSVQSRGAKERLSSPHSPGIMTG